MLLSRALINLVEHDRFTGGQRGEVPRKVCRTARRRARKDLPINRLVGLPMGGERVRAKAAALNMGGTL